MVVDEKLIETVRRSLYAAVLSDVLDGLGYRHQVLPPWVRPLDERVVLCGRARTGLYRDVYHVPPGHNPYELEIALVDDLRPGDVPVLGCGRSGRIAPWGELLTTASMARTAASPTAWCATSGQSGSSSSRCSTAASGRSIPRAAARSAPSTCRSNAPA